MKKPLTETERWLLGVFIVAWSCFIMFAFSVAGYYFVSIAQAVLKYLERCGNASLP